MLGVMAEILGVGEKGPVEGGSLGGNAANDSLTPEAAVVRVHRGFSAIEVIWSLLASRWHGGRQ